jgi:hypothetical protein
MIFLGLPKDEDIDNVIAYLKQLGPTARNPERPALSRADSGQEFVACVRRRGNCVKGTKDDWLTQLVQSKCLPCGLDRRRGSERNGRGSQ